MKLELITEGLRKLLCDNGYSFTTIRFYEREWRKIHDYRLSEFGDTEYDMDKGLKYLENQYGFITECSDGALSQQRVQLLRVVNMLEDYRLHRVLTRRYHASKNPIVLTGRHKEIFAEYDKVLQASELSISTREHYCRSTKVFLDYLNQIKVEDISQLSYEHCTDYLKTLAGYSYKTIEQIVCGLRHFLRTEYRKGKLTEDYASKIHMPPVSKSAKIPSTWTIDELRAMIAAIDRNSPIGKRDYAMIMIASVLGLRAGDIKRLKFSDFNWKEKELSIIQHKTGKPLTLPVTDEVGWAVIDYIKNGRPDFR